MTAELAEKPDKFLQCEGGRDGEGGGGGEPPEESLSQLT